MQYLATDRAIKHRQDPTRILPGCRSILVLGIAYAPPSKSVPEHGPPLGRIAAYAQGQDYHDLLKPLLESLVAFIEKESGTGVVNRWYTDTGPVLERDLAQRAGLGWIGKNTCLIHPEQGSYFLLAEILLGIDLKPDTAFSTDHCGTCTRCIDACPTGCILPGRTLDAARCISYLTIENKGPVSPELRPGIQDRVFGCDICQEVCPWNIRFAPPEGFPALSSRPELAFQDLSAALSLTAEEFNRKFKGNPVKRAKRRGYLRNIAIALGNNGDPNSVPALSEALKDHEVLVRGHAAWALGEIGGHAALEALSSALITETEPGVLAEIQSASDRIRASDPPV